MHLVHSGAPQYLSDTTQLSTPSRGAEPSSESAASLMLDLLHGTVFHTISMVFSSAASKLNYFVEHTSLVLVSAPGRSVNSAIEMSDCIIII